MSGCPMKQGNQTEKALNYDDYLQLSKILDAQTLKSEVKDEHLFITVHQVFELWFQQIIYDIDVAREVFSKREAVNEDKLLDLVKRFQRTVLILKMCNNQMYILETITPFDFLQFRNFLFPASGFQSWQFRILENVLGVRDEKRMKYNNGSYKQAFDDQTENKKQIEKAEKEVPLLKHLDGWLQHTLKSHEEHFKFYDEYKKVINAKLETLKKEAEEQTDEKIRKDKLEAYNKKKDMFEKVLFEDQHAKELENGSRRFSHDALFGALMIFLYREKFSLAHQLLHLLMDVDSLIAKWRYSHMMIVQRMIGSLTAGTGGSQGYQYLKGTVCGEQYKVFLDLFDLSAFLLSDGEKPLFPNGQ